MKTFSLAAVALLLTLSIAYAGGFSGAILNQNTKYINYSGCFKNMTTPSVMLVQGGAIAQSYDKVYIQGAAPDPDLSFVITDNFSHILTAKTKGVPWLWFNLLYNGTSGCIVRMMKTTDKASYPAIPVLP